MSIFEKLLNMYVAPSHSKTDWIKNEKNFDYTRIFIVKTRSRAENFSFRTHLEKPFTSQWSQIINISKSAANQPYLAGIEILDTWTWKKIISLLKTMGLLFLGVTTEATFHLKYKKPMILNRNHFLSSSCIHDFPFRWISQFRDRFTYVNGSVPLRGKRFLKVFLKRNLYRLRQIFLNENSCLAEVSSLFFFKRPHCEPVLWLIYLCS